MRELKVKVNDLAALMVRLEELDAKEGARVHATNVYFNQPPGDVLKITQDETGDFLIRHKIEGGGFRLVSRDPIEDVDAMRTALTQEHGVKSVLQREAIEYSIPGKSYSLELNLITDVADILVIMDENPELAIATNDLGFENPEVITVPFDEL